MAIYLSTYSESCNLNKFKNLMEESLDDLDSAKFFYHTDFEDIARISLAIFNEVPNLTFITYKDTEELDKHCNILIRIGTLIGLSVIELNYMEDLFTLNISDMTSTIWYDEWSIIFNQIKEAKRASNSKTNICVQCGIESSYAEPEESYMCWGCRNGY